MNQINQQTGHRIKAMRRKIGITQADLSKKLSISPSYLNLIESGKRKINLDLLLKVANELNIEVSDISTFSSFDILSKKSKSILRLPLSIKLR